MRLVALILLLLPAVALADPGTIMLIGSIMTASSTTWVVVTGYGLMVGAAVYGADQQRKQAAAEREKKRQAYNAALQDRTATRVATDAPYRYVYGRARVGSDIVAMFTSGDRDEYKWLVCVHAAHECDAIEEVYINGKALGALDGNGDVTGGDFLYSHPVPVADEMHIGTSWTLDHTPVPGSLRVVWLDSNDKRHAVPYTLTGADVTVDTSKTYYCQYDYTETIPRVRVSKHLGAQDDPADAGLMAAVAGWPATSVLRGFCYTVVRLDLNHAEFQGGVPPVEVLLRGKKLYDPRSGLTVWNQNPALAIRDYLISEICNVDAADIPDAEYIAAANVCDEVEAFGVRYTINGAVTADQDSTKVLAQMAACMAGGLVGTTWSVWAGKYVAPVMALDQSDIVGALSVIGGTSDADLYNGVRGRYIGAENNYVPTDVVPYQNAAYLAADGRELWNDMEFPFTDTATRIHNLARIAVEDQRNGFTIKASFSLKTFKLKPGNRVTFTSAFLGQANKVYRVTDKRYGPAQAVELTLKEDSASIYDLADAVVVDATPNTNLTNPFSIGLCGNVQMAESLYETSGSVGVRSKATISWDAPSGALSDYFFELEYKSYETGAWIELFNVVGTQYELYDLAPGRYDVRVRACNSLGAVGAYTEIKTFNIYGLTANPEDVSNFSVRAFNGAAIASWNRTTSLDVKLGGWMDIRFSPITSGATWADAHVLLDANSLIHGDASSAQLPLASGTYFAKFVDSSGNASINAASFVLGEALLNGWVTVASTAQHPEFAGLKSATVATDGILKLENTVLWDSMVGNLDDQAGQLDSLGGIVLSGSYEFDAVLDLGSVAARRFHGHIKTLAYNDSDLFDSRTGNMDDWGDFDGSIVDDCSAMLYASVSDDSISYGPWVQFIVADFNCRYAKFKLDLTSAVAIHNIDVSELSVTVKTLV